MNNNIDDNLKCFAIIFLVVATIFMVYMMCYLGGGVYE